MKTRAEYILLAVLLVIFAIVLVVGGRLVSGDTPEQRYEAALAARRPFYGHELLDVPEDEKLECMRWACGEDVLSAARNTLSDRWRDLHPDLPVIYDSDSVEHGYKIIGDEWTKHKAALAAATASVRDANHLVEEVGVAWADIHAKLDEFDEPNEYVVIDVNHSFWKPENASVHDIGNVVFYNDTMSQAFELAYDHAKNELHIKGGSAEDVLRLWYFASWKIYDPNDYLMSAKIVFDEPNERTFCSCTGNRGTITCLVYGCDGADCTTCMDCGLKIMENQ